MMTGPTTTHQTERKWRDMHGCKRSDGSHPWPNPTLLYKMMMMRIVVLLCARPCAASTRTEYYMDDSSVCNLRGYIDIPSDVTISIQLKQPGAPISTLKNCMLRFRAENDRELLAIQYKDFLIRDCTISFNVNQQHYRCNAAKPHDAKLATREVDLQLNRPEDTENYGGELFLATYESMDPGPRDDAVSNPSLIGIIIGSVCGVILVILLLAVIGICCYQRNSYQRGSHADPVLHDVESSDMDKYYINSLEKNGSTSPSLRFTDVVKEYSDSKDEKDEARLGVGVDGGREKPLVVDALAMSPKKSGGELKFDGGGDGPRSPMVDALQSNLKFRASYQSAENEAEERAQRLSSSSHHNNNNNNNDGGGGVSDTPPTPPPPLMVVSAPPLSKTRHTDLNHAAIRRVPARTSASSDDLDLLERELLSGAGVQDEEGDPRIKVLKPDIVQGSAAEVVPIKIQSSKPKEVVEAEDLEHIDLTTDNPPFSRGGHSGSSSTHHSLRPNRHRSPAGKSKQQHQPQSQQQQEPTARSKDAGVSSLRKRGPKSPRLTTKGRRLVSQAEEESVYGDEQLQRADTPLSMMGVRSSRADDLESLPPLRRSASKQSLFASRTSLYSRRGKKERRPSVADSLDSYAQDDLNMYSSGVQAQPVSKQDARAYKSLGSIIAPLSSKALTGDAGYSTGQKPKKSSTGTTTTTTSSSSRQMPKKSTSSHKSSMSTQTSENKGTQMEGRATSGTQLNQQQQLRPVPLAKPLLKPTVKSQPSRNIANGAGGAETSHMSAKLPPSSLKSHFQPIAYNTTATVPRASPIAATDPALPPPPLPPTTDTLRSTKSPWELLCELTDTNVHTSPASEAGVSTLGSGSGVGPASRFAASSTATSTATTTTPPLPPLAAGNGAASIGSDVPTDGSFIPATAPLPHPNVTLAPTRYTPSSMVGSETLPTNSNPAVYHQKSSWDALKELTDNQISYEASHRNTESIV